MVENLAWQLADAYTQAAIDAVLGGEILSV